MVWIVVVAGWLLVAPLLAWVVGTAVVIADRANPPLQLDEATDDAACPAAEVLEPALAAAG